MTPLQEQLRARAAAHGVPVNEDDWDAIETMVGRTLDLLKGFDQHALKRLEPSVVFRRTAG